MNIALSHILRLVRRWIFCGAAKFKVVRIFFFNFWVNVDMGLPYLYFMCVLHVVDVCLITYGEVVMYAHIKFQK